MNNNAKFDIKYTSRCLNAIAVVLKMPVSSLIL